MMTVSDIKQSMVALRAPLRIVLLVGSEALARGLEAVLGGIPNIASVTQADPVSLARLVEDGAVDVVVISVDQWSALADYADSALASTIKVLVIGDDLHAKHSNLLGSLPANGFASMADLSVERLGDTLDRVLSGEMPMPPELARHLLSGVLPAAVRTGHRPASLTSRESETLALLVQGMSNKQIARVLGISTHGVKRLVTAILLKLGVSNRTAAVVEAMQSGLV